MTRLNGNDYRKLAKAKWLQENGVCNVCGTTEGPFDIDHIVPKFLTGNKLKTREIWGLNAERIAKELEHCQALCKKCHIRKTSYDLRLYHSMRRQGLLK